MTQGTTWSGSTNPGSLGRWPNYQFNADLSDLRMINELQGYTAFCLSTQGSPKLAVIIIAMPKCAAPKPGAAAGRCVTNCYLETNYSTIGHMQEIYLHNFGTPFTS